MMKALFRLAMGVACLTVSINAFVTPGQHHHNQRAITQIQMGGFGAASTSKGKKGKTSGKNENKATKLKPRKQWDRFISDDLKSSDRIAVAVRVVSSPGADVSKWYPVGEVKSKDNAHTEASVIRHRMLISEHARRMFPAEVLPNDTLEWGYCPTKNTNTEDDEECEWTIAGKVDTMPSDIDKLIGFLGYADLTGFYSSVKGSSSSNITPGTNSSDQSGYGSMKNKGITGHSPLEVHD